MTLPCADVFVLHVLKRAQVTDSRYTYQRNLLPTPLPTEKLVVISERNDPFLLEKILKLIEHVSHSIGYCKILALIYSGNSSLSNAWLFDSAKTAFDPLQS